MRKYVTENIISCVKKNGIFPQDVQIRENQFIHFTKVGLTVYRLTNREGSTFKHINYWQTLNTEKINKLLNDMEWKKEDYWR